MSSSNALSALMGPQELYELWERQQWASAAIDFTQDRRDWERLDELDREHLLWNLESFCLGEHRVTSDFTPLVMAHESDSEEAFLCTQQVDEARHAQHFDRFRREVVGDGGGGGAESNPALATLFDEYLTPVGRRLLDDPADRVTKAEFVTTYHLFVEGVIALSGQTLLTSYCEERGVLPGLLEGMRAVTQDEHRHIAFGVWYLRRAASDPQIARRVRALVPKLLRLSRDTLTPPDGDPETPVLGQPPGEGARFAYAGLHRRLKMIGVPLPAMERLATRA
jgi:ribonucleoside-diphosphate reductase beta chain